MLDKNLTFTKLHKFYRYMKNESVEVEWKRLPTSCKRTNFYSNELNNLNQT